MDSFSKLVIPETLPALILLTMFSIYHPPGFCVVLIQNYPRCNALCTCICQEPKEDVAFKEESSRTRENVWARTILTLFGWYLYPSRQIQHVNPVSLDISSNPWMTAEGLVMIFPLSVAWKSKHKTHVLLSSWKVLKQFFSFHTLIPRAPSCFSLIAMASFFFSCLVSRRTAVTWKKTYFNTY